MNLGERLFRIRKDYDLTMEQLAERLNSKYGLKISKSMVSRWESNDTIPNLPHIQAYAKEFNADMNHLIGITLDEDYISSKKMVHIPVYGDIPAGVAIEAIEDIQGYEDIPAEWLKGGKEFIALKVKGDSMYPKYLDGDTVIIQKQADCESGQDCACYVNGFNATLKKVKKSLGKIELIPFNPNYAPETYNHPGEVKIVGVVKELRRKVL